MVDELVFEDGDDEAMKWSEYGVPANHTYFGTSSIVSTRIREIKLPKWEKLALFDDFICYNDELERIVFPDYKAITYRMAKDYMGAMTVPFYGYFIKDCPNLREVVSLGETPPQIIAGSDYSGYKDYRGETGEFEFMDNIDDCVLKVPAGSEELYRADPVWGKFKTIYGFENGDYTSIVMPEVAAPETEAVPVYHNLQGMRVEHPVRGQLYIRTIGSCTDKVVY